MHPDLQWHTHPRATILHALRLLAEGTPVLDHAIVPLLTATVPRLQLAGLNDRFWCQLLPVPTRDPEFTRRLERAARQSQLEYPAHEIAQILLAAEQRVLASDVDLIKELRLRQRPLRELWEASGPGLLLQIGQWTMRPILPRVQLDGLLPLRGGFGQAFPGTQRVQIELVLANPAAQVPEVIRLAWLIAQLSIPDSSDFATDRLALVPCCLAAAEQLGLAQCQPPSLVEALRQWRIVDQRADEAGVALYRWWTARDENLGWIQLTKPLSKWLAQHGLSDR